MEKKKKLHYLKKLNSQRRTSRHKRKSGGDASKSFLYTGLVTGINHDEKIVEIKTIDTKGDVDTADIPFEFISQDLVSNIEPGWVCKIYIVHGSVTKETTLKVRFPKRYWKKQVLEVAEAAGETLAKMFDTLDTAILITNDDPAVVASIVEALNGTPTVLETETERYNKWQIDEK